MVVLGLVLVVLPGVAGPAAAAPGNDGARKDGSLSVTDPSGKVHTVSAATLTAANAGVQAEGGAKALPPGAGRNAPGIVLPGDDPPAPRPGQPPPPRARYFYGEGYQRGEADGAWAGFVIQKPVVASADAHSLGELAVSSADFNQAIEIGWTVSPSLNGNSNPHLFIYLTVDGVGTCYNYGCGFIQVGSQLGPGFQIEEHSSHILQIQQFQGNWWIGDTWDWMGYVPNSIFGGRFTKVGLTQLYGEVATFSTSPPCTDMGNGLYASEHNSSATIAGIGYWNGPTVNLTIRETNSDYYTAIYYLGNNLRFGGPGAC
jgi:hypothetical protein